MRPLAPQQSEEHSHYSSFKIGLALVNVLFNGALHLMGLKGT